jgi:hypothetical protein
VFEELKEFCQKEELKNWNLKLSAIRNIRKKGIKRIIIMICPNIFMQT